MDWLKPIFGGSKSEQKLPPATPLQMQRARQIETLKSFQNAVSEIQRDSDYRLTVNLSGNQTVFLNIHLPTMFPQEKPVVTVTPAVQHSWLNAQNVIIGCPGINNFVMHSDLSRVLRDIVEEFQRNPPKFSSLPYPIRPAEAAALPNVPTASFIPPYPSVPASVSEQTATTYMAPVQMPSLPGGAVIDRQVGGAAASFSSQKTFADGLPAAPSFLTTLKQLDTDSLKELLDDEEKLLSVLMNSDEVKQLGKDREEMCKINENLARSNLEKRPEIEKKKEELLQQVEELMKKQKDFDTQFEQQQEQMDKFSPATLKINLQLAALQAEEDSEAIAQQFLNGSLDTKSFLEQFLKVRTLHHGRRAKEERFGHATL